jgi:hypothetical protein
MRLPPILAALAAALLAGCASRPCPTDWFGTGRADGAAGHELRRFSNHARACSRDGGIVDEGAYRRGWDEGNAAYCVRPTGEAQGAAGQGPAPACAAREGYLAGWNAGIARFCTPERGQADGAAGADPNPYCDGRNRDAYRAGFAWGLAAWCTSENGWQAGWRGASPRGLCRGVGGDAYLRGHRLGASAHETQQQLDEIGREIRKLEADLAATADASRRAVLAERLREANRDQRQLREQLTRLQTAR